jgi:hypothetical protein
MPFGRGYVRLSLLHRPSIALRLRRRCFSQMHLVPNYLPNFAMTAICASPTLGRDAALYCMGSLQSYSARHMNGCSGGVLGPTFFLSTYRMSFAEASSSRFPPLSFTHLIVPFRECGAIHPQPPCGLGVVSSSLPKGFGQFFIFWVFGWAPHVGRKP